MMHIYEVHRKCRIPYCNICDGGLSVCEVCGLSEGSLTTHCPGEKVPYEVERKIYDEGGLDYRAHSGWIAKDNPTHQMWKYGKDLDRLRKVMKNSKAIEIAKTWGKKYPSVLRRGLERIK